MYKSLNVIIYPFLVFTFLGRHKHFCVFDHILKILIVEPLIFTNKCYIINQHLHLYLHLNTYQLRFIRNLTCSYMYIVYVGCVVFLSLLILFNQNVECINKHHTLNNGFSSLISVTSMYIILKQFCICIFVNIYVR